MAALRGSFVVLRPATGADVADLARIRSTPAVRVWWRGDDLEDEVRADLEDPELQVLVIEYDGRAVGAIQWSEETDPDYRHATVDIYLDPAVHGRGIGTDAVRTLARHLFESEGHHRLVIDPAVGNEAAIRCYTKVGFKPVGVMRSYERGLNGSWHDGLLMDLLVSDLIAG